MNKIEKSHIKMITNRILGDYNYNDSINHPIMTNDRHKNNRFYHNRDRKIYITLLLIAIFMCKCGAVTGNATEPPDCAGVVCDLNCPSDSKVTRIYGYDSINMATNASEAPLDGETTTKRKRAVLAGRQESIKIVPGDYIRHRRDVNDSLAIQKCCECKCDYAKCPDLKCQPNEFKVTVSQGIRIPGSCCPKFSCSVQRPTCYSHNLRRSFNPSEQWKDDACTQCECTETGDSRCETPICKPLSCEKKHTIEGECCPVCDISDNKFCDPDIDCEVHCRNGFEHDPVRNCAICVCAKSLRTTKKTTVFMESDDIINSTVDVITTNQPPTWNPDIRTGTSTDFVDNTNASSTKPFGDEDSWLMHLPIVLVICVTIGAFTIILSLTCRHISHKKDKNNLNRKQNTPLI